MNRNIAIAAFATIGLAGMSACTPQQIHKVLATHHTATVVEVGTPADVGTVIDPPYFPPCDAATGYYETGGKDSVSCVQPPMRTDCTDGQALTKAGYFECNQPPETTIPNPDPGPPATK